MSIATEKKVETASEAPIVVSLGKQRRKRIKELVQGKGKLMDEVNNVVAELRTSGKIAPAAQQIIVVVKERPKRRNLMPRL
jgi:uncharacterized protein (UPF0335 family)